ncbi:MAG: chromosomal replication initiator protein DnaA [Succinivibrio sp.]
MDLEQIWKDAIAHVIATLSQPTDIAVVQCIETQCSITISGDNVCFVCSNDLASKLLPKFVNNLFVEIIHLLGNSNYGMQIAMAGSSGFNTQPNQNTTMNLQQPAVSSPQPNFFQPAPSANQPFSPFSNAQVGAVTEIEKPMISDNINPEKTFENYVTDPENELVYVIAMQIAKDPGSETYNPFYIYGGSGLGKTHILWAIANKIRETKPEVSVIYIRAEEFLRRYVDSMSKKNSFAPQQVHFKDMFTQYDVFIMDDIQSLTKGDKARDSFFDIIASFLDKKGKQLILASDVPPGNLKNFSERLVTRFGSGVCREIYPPSPETRAAITLSKCRELNFELPESIVDYIANNIRSSVREIEGAIKTLKSHVDIKGQMITYDEAVKSLSNLVNVSSQVTTLDTIKERVAKEFEVSVASMESAERKKATSNARSMAMTLANDLIPNLSLNDLGRSFNKDHSSVHEAIKRTRERISNNQEIAAVYQKLTLSLKKN